MANQTLTVPLPDGNQIPISQLEVGKAKEMLGVYSCLSEDDTVHINLNLKIIKQVETWTNRTKSSHLPSKFVWVLYRFKLWPGIRYGLATLATPLFVHCIRLVIKGSLPHAVISWGKQEHQEGVEKFPPGILGCWTLQLPGGATHLLAQYTDSAFWGPLGSGEKFSSALGGAATQGGCQHKPPQP